MKKNIPLYIQVADEMRNNIVIGKWEEGIKIPSEFELCDIFHVSRITIRKAIDELIRDNLLYRKKPIGTFVKSSESIINDRNYTLVKSASNEMKELGIHFETLKVSIELSTADHTIAKFLHIHPGEKIIILKRIRGNNKKPLGYFITYFKYEPYFSLDKNDYTGSFYEYLATKNIHIIHNQEVVEAILPVSKIAKLLKVNMATPLLRRCRFTSDFTKNFYEFSECYYIGSDYKYYIDFSY